MTWTDTPWRQSPAHRLGVVAGVLAALALAAWATAGVIHVGRTEYVYPSALTYAQLGLACLAAGLIAYGLVYLGWRVARYVRGGATQARRVGDRTEGPG